MLHTNKIQSKIDDTLDADASFEEQVNAMFDAIQNDKDIQQFQSEIDLSRVLMGESCYRSLDESEKNRIIVHGQGIICINYSVCYWC